MIDATLGQAALALTFSMVPQTRHTNGEQNTSLLLPPRPNRGKANLASRIRTIEKSPRRTRPFAPRRNCREDPSKPKIAKNPKVFGVRPREFPKAPAARKPRRQGLSVRQRRCDFQSYGGHLRNTFFPFSTANSRPSARSRKVAFDSTSKVRAVATTEQTILPKR